ncbi:ABC transporter permease [Mycobacteroides franklinii]|uniref:ABC transporter permease n=1 Tax=Mycobacteroides franklinii TaxID=948102 RepID=A0A4R5PDE5_9MYCO|nr:ABC transporter permease [Mycobacteroides franklinii]TDH22414.1 ABC transporter permease [Mycobacteroides franklinii]
MPFGGWNLTRRIEQELDESTPVGGHVHVSDDEGVWDSSSLPVNPDDGSEADRRRVVDDKTQRDGVWAIPARAVAAGTKAVSKVVSIPTRSAGTAGRAAILAASVFRYAVIDTLTLRLAFGELIVQAWSLLKVTALPAVLMAIPFGAMVAVQISGLVNEVGANSLVGSVTGVAVLRQGAPVTAGLLMGGAAAAAIASDFGARAIREELDALRALGIDPVRRLVVPRFLALLLITPILVVIVIAMGVGAAFLIATLVNDVTPGSFWLSFGSFAKLIDLWFTMGKGFLFAAIVAVISAQRGMEAKGGPRGVADAVNASVVLNVISIIVVNLAVTQLQTMFFPMAVA